MSDITEFGLNMLLNTDADKHIRLQKHRFYSSIFAQKLENYVYTHLYATNWWAASVDGSAHILINNMEQA